MNKKNKKNKKPIFFLPVKISVLLLAFFSWFNCSLPLSAAQDLPDQGLSAAIKELEYRDEITFNHPNFAQQLDNGNLLVCRVGYQAPEVLELTPAGQKIWSYSGVQASSALRLSSGNTLIADSGAPGAPFVPRVIEVIPEGGIIWEYRLSSLSQAPRYAEQLVNGNILITLPFKILEVNRDKKVVWSYGWGRPVPPATRGYLANPLQATRLGNGNTLIVDGGLTGGRVFEITPGKDIVWQYGGGNSETLTVDAGSKEQQAIKTAQNANTTASLKFPTGALRLPGGNTLITDTAASTLLEVSPEAKLMRSFSWKDALSGLPLMNQWRVSPLEQKGVIIPCTLTNSCSRILAIKFNG